MKILQLVSLSVIVLLGLSMPAAHAQQASLADKPNILLIVVDDQAWSNFNRDLMPNVFSEIADKGTTFNRGYVASPWCCPSRSEIYTGLFEHSTGVDGFRAVVEYNSGRTTPDPTIGQTIALTQPTISEAAHDLGYATIFAGKYINNLPCTPPPYFDRWVCNAQRPPREFSVFVSNNSLLNPTLNVNGVWTSFTGRTMPILVDHLISDLSAVPEEKPFFAVFAPTAPHLPANDPSYPEYVESTPYRPESANFDSSPKPEFMRRGPLLDSEWALIDGARRVMGRSIKAMDDEIGRLLTTVDARQRKTVVIYISDNGYLFGEHRHVQKSVAYEETIRVPFLIRDTVPAAQASTQALVENIDIAPTIADYLGLDWKADGRSLLPLIRGETPAIRETLLSEYCYGAGYPCEGELTQFALWRPQLKNAEVYPASARATLSYFLSPPYRAIVGERYKLVDYYTGERQLFDLQDDPHEITNLANADSPSELEQSLAAQLEAHYVAVPETAIVSWNQADAASRILDAKFTASVRATFQCRLSEATLGEIQTWHDCPSRYVAGPLEDGDYQLEVFATDGVRSDATPASRSFSIHSAGPAVAITAGPGAVAASRSPTFEFSSAEVVQGFECRLIKRPRHGSTSWSACTSPFTPSSLADGQWTFEVRAIDGTGVASSVPTVALFSVDYLPPVASFKRRPPMLPVFTTNTTAHFEFVLNEPAVSVTCAIDGRAPVGCSSGTAEFTDLADGNHTMVISAQDTHGNQGDAARVVWTQDRTKPTLTLTASPSAARTQVDPVLTLDSLEADNDEDTIDEESAGLRSFRCQVDGGSVWICPKQIVTEVIAATPGTHSVNAWAIDAAGNLSDPVSYSWTKTSDTPVVSMSDIEIQEGGVATVTLTLDLAPARAVNISYQTVAGTAGTSDFVPVTRTARFAAGTTSTSFSINTKEDSQYEPDEQFSISYSPPSGATLSRNASTVTILDNESPPALSVADISVTETTGSNLIATINVQLSSQSPDPVSFDYGTADGTAGAKDYSARQGSLTIAAGRTTASIKVPVIGDSLSEATESFTVTLSNPVGAGLSKAVATVSISDDDPLQTLSFTNPTVVEGGLVRITASLDFASGQPVSFDYATQPGSAATSDFRASSGSVTIPAGSRSATISLSTVKDTIYEGTEQYSVAFTNAAGASLAASASTVTLTDDDPVPQISISDAVVTEVAGKNVTARADVVLSNPSDQAVSVTYRTVAGSAGETDYAATSGTLTIPAGTTKKSIVVTVRDDLLIEGDESLSVIIENPVGASLLRDTATLTIHDNE